MQPSPKENGSLVSCSSVFVALLNFSAPLGIHVAIKTIITLFYLIFYNRYTILNNFIELILHVRLSANLCCIKLKNGMGSMITE